VGHKNILHPEKHVALEVGAYHVTDACKDMTVPIFKGGSGAGRRRYRGSLRLELRPILVLCLDGKWKCCGNVPHVR